MTRLATQNAFDALRSDNQQAKANGGSSKAKAKAVLSEAEKKQREIDRERRRGRRFEPLSLEDPVRRLTYVQARRHEWKQVNEAAEWAKYYRLVKEKEGIVENPDPRQYQDERIVWCTRNNRRQEPPRSSWGTEEKTIMRGNKDRPEAVRGPIMLKGSLAHDMFRNLEAQQQVSRVNASNHWASYRAACTNAYNLAKEEKVTCHKPAEPWCDPVTKRPPLGDWAKQELQLLVDDQERIKANANGKYGDKYGPRVPMPEVKIEVPTRIDEL